MSDVQSKQGGARVRIPPPLVFAGAIAIGLALQYAVLRWTVPLDTAWRLVAGAVAVAAGLGLGASAIVLFRRSGQDPAPWKPSPSMIAGGPYRFTRNPIYVGMTLVTIGIGLCANTLWIVALGAAALLIVHFKAVLPEEAYLSERFGADYDRYRARVRRYL